MKTQQKTRGQRRTEWHIFRRRGATYSSRWGVTSRPVRFARRGEVVVDAAIVDPDATADQRAALDAPLTARRKAHSDSLAPVSAAMAAFLLAMIALPGLGRAMPDDMNTNWWICLAAAALVLPSALAWFILVRHYRRAAVIPDDLHKLVRTGTGPEGENSADDVVLYALALGELENTPGTTDDEVDAAWREAWEKLSHATEHSEAERQAETEWASTPVAGPGDVAKP